MKKIFAIMLSALLMMSCLPVFAESVGMANPWSEVASPEELNEAAGTTLQLPGVMGVTDVVCRMMDAGDYKLAELDFKVNGMQYMFRSAFKFDEDISGVYMSDGKTAFEGDTTGDLLFVDTGTEKLAHWMNIDGQFVLMVSDNGEMPMETFEEIVKELQTATQANPMNTLESGTYYDSVSQRATAEVTALGNDTYAIEIHWADSATEDNVWTMTATMTEDGLLSYTDCVLEHVMTAEDGTETRTPADLVQDGYFETTADTLYWTGAAQENCRGCVFEYAAQ